jgi:type III restriction enzyme
VLCSVAEMRSSTYVEQILGRIMRLPKAEWKDHDELNVAYAFAASEGFAQAARALEDALVESGFERQEARDLIQPVGQDAQATFDDLATFMNTVTVHMPEPPKTAALTEDLATKIVFDLAAKKMTFHGLMIEPERETLGNCFSTPEGKASVEELYRRSNTLLAVKTPSERGVVFSVPVLAIKQDDLLEPLETTHFLDHPWQLSKCDAALSENEYSAKRPEVQIGEIDFEEGRGLTTRFLGTLQAQMALLDYTPDWSVARLVRWLDHVIPHKDITGEETGIFLTHIIQSLMRDRNLAVEQLAYDKYRLKEACVAKIEKHRQQAKNEAYQALLSPDCETPLVVTPDVCFTYDARAYPHSSPYRGHYTWSKHYYPQVGELESKGEEFECAQFIDQLGEVEVK